MTIDQLATRIVDEGRNARHPRATVLMALTYTKQKDSLHAWRKLNRIRSTGIPRWLVERWASRLEE